MRTKLTIRRPVALVAGTLVIALVGCSGKSSPTEENLATVNGEAITMREYVTFLERKPSVQVVTPQGPQEAQVASMLGLQALRDLVQRHIVLQLAKEDNLYPTDAKVKEELDFQEQRRGNFVAALAAQGIDLQTIKDDIRFTLAREALQTKGITVPMSEVETFIKENPQNFMEPERASLRWIVVSDPAKKAVIDKDLASGKDFQTAAVQYSEAPDARQSGGAYSTDVVTQMPPVLQQLVQKTPALKATAWQQDGQNSVKFFVQSKTPAKKMPITDVIKRSVQRDLALQRGQAANDVAKRIAERLRVAKIDVLPKYLKEPWDKIFEQAKTQMAQEDAASAGAGARSGAPSPAPAPATGATGGSR